MAASRASVSGNSASQTTAKADVSTVVLIAGKAGRSEGIPKL
ncbi:hypothetical protein [Ferruginibacter sp.]|nr:hypothetical protein [Ferruginibacter sp.]